MAADDFLKEAEAIVAKDEVSEADLTDSEKAKVREGWDKGISDLKALIQFACGDQYDGRSKKGMGVKKYLSEQELYATPAQKYTKKTDGVVLSPANKEFIANNASVMKPLEITRILFDNLQLTPLSKEFRVVKGYYDNLDLKVKAQGSDEDVKQYYPPRNEEQALARINKYVFEGIDPAKMTPTHKEWFARLIKVMHTHRFLFEMNALQKKSERELFESSFVRYCFDKPDLTEEEVDLYLNLCSDIVNYQRMQRELDTLIEYRDNTMQEEQKVPMALVEAIGKLRSDMDSSFKRQKTTLNDLNGVRSKRLDKIQSNSENILKLVEAFRDETERGHILRVMENRKKEVDGEIARLESTEDLHFHLFGASPKELR